MTTEQTTTQTMETKTWKTLLANFEMKTYNGFEIMVHKETLYINATKLCHDVSLTEGKHIKEFYKLKKSPQFLDYVNYLWEKMGPNQNGDTRSAVKNYLIHPELFDMVEVVNGKGYPNEVRGQYVHPDLIHCVLTMTSIKYLDITTQLMNSIDKTVHKKLEELKLPDIPKHAEPIFVQTVKTLIPEENLRGQRAFEAQYCWGIRD